MTGSPHLSHYAPVMQADTGWIRTNRTSFLLLYSQISEISGKRAGKCHDNDLVVSFISAVCKGQLQLKSRNVLSVA